MTTIILSFIVFTLAGLGLAVGLLGRKRKIQGACCQMSPPAGPKNPCCMDERQQNDQRSR